MGGFSYNGVHCEDLGLYYAPNAAARMLSTPSYKPNTQAVTAHPGAYWYGNTVDARVFTLECYYEDATVAQTEEILQWLDRNSHGQLIFDDRPYVYYLVRPSKAPTGNRYVGHCACTSPDELVYSGTLTLEFTAYDPFGYMNFNTVGDWDEEAVQATGILTDAMMPENTTALGNHLIYNPGTEACPLRITLAGSAPNGLTITNYSTGDVCTILSLPENDALVIDGYTGLVALNSNHNPAFSYHDDGYIHLTSCVPYHRNVEISWTQGSTAITSDGKFRKRDEGSYIWLAGEWRKIVQVNNNDQAVLNLAVAQASGTEAAFMGKMNEIYISGDGAELTQLDFDYTPRVR